MAKSAIGIPPKLELALKHITTSAKILIRDVSQADVHTEIKA
jgi:hypothetical protein